MSPATTPDGQVALELYEAVEPLAYDDANRDYATVNLINAWGKLLEPLANVVLPDPDVRAPWALVYDLDNAPVEWLPWLAQWVGVRIPAGLDEVSTRLRIAETDGFNRGSVGAIMGAARQHLTGTRTVLLRERYDASDPLVDSAYHLLVNTYASETPDPALVLEALIAQKPAGIILTYEAVDGQDYQQVVDTFATYQDVKDAYPTYADLRNATP